MHYWSKPNHLDRKFSIVLVPAGSLPAFIPGFEAGSDHVHVTHALVSLVIALALFALAWFQRRSEEY